MDTIICSSCNEEVARNPKLKGKSQGYCGKNQCQRARKASWKRKKLASSQESKSNQALSNKKWSKANRAYWRQYRAKHPDKAERNRLLQHIRNQRVRLKVDPIDCKGGRVNIPKNQLVGQFWLLPMIAKVDALKVNISTINDS